MNKITHSLGRSTFALLAVLIFAGRPAAAALFTADVLLDRVEGAHVDYAQARFDFGTAFSSIQSVRLELDMPAGFQGFATRTGNSYYSRKLLIQIHDEFYPPPANDYPSMLSTWQTDVPAGPRYVYDFRPPWIGSSPDVETRWPTFLFSGHGDVTVVDVYSASSRPSNPSTETWPMTIVWQPPVGVLSAQLIVDATPIPEPSTAGHLLLSVAAFSLAPRRERR